MVNIRFGWSLACSRRTELKLIVLILIQSDERNSSANETPNIWNYVS